MSSLPAIALIPGLLFSLVPSRAETTRQPLDFREVEVGGELQTRLERNFGRLHARRYSEPVLFTETADPNWPGDYEGRTGLALVLGAQALRIDPPGIDSLMAAFPRHYNEQGYFGTVHLPDAVDEQQLSSHGWTLRALCEYYNWRKTPETKAQINRGKPEVLAKAEQVFETYLREGCTENFENYNWFGRPEWTEPCAIIDSFLVACQLWQHTGKPAHLEAAQQIYFNGICATQRSNGGWGLNNCSGSSHAFLGSVNPEAYWCCSMRGAEGLAAAARYCAFKDDGGLWLTTFMDNRIEAEFPAGVLTLKQKSAYPMGESTRVTVKSAPAAELELRFFTPSFLPPDEILVNSEKIDSENADGFIAIRRTWKKGDVVEYRFRAKVLRQGPRNRHTIDGHDLIRHGPHLMSLMSEEQPKDQNSPPPVVAVPDPEDPRLRPVYHLLDPTFDELEGSWRQMLFPHEEPATNK